MSECHRVPAALSWRSVLRKLQRSRNRVLCGRILLSRGIVVCHALISDSVFTNWFLQGSTSRTPVAVPGWTRSIGADVCPPGHFCPYASEDPQDCPPGTYSFSTGNTNISDCMTCTAGHYCPNASTVAPMECPIGYYCPIGTVYYNLICDEGYYCPAGSATQTVRAFIAMFFTLPN